MSLTVDTLDEHDLLAAKKIISLSFGTFFGDPDPENFWSDIEYASTRYRADPSNAFAVKENDQLIGSNFVSRWGSVGFFGPMTVHPDHWESGAGQLLLKKAVECFDAWQLDHTGLFTFAHSPKHIHLYQKFGFWPRFLTAIMLKEVAPKKSVSNTLHFCQLNTVDKTTALNQCQLLTNDIYPGLKLETEIQSVERQNLGGTVLLYNQNDELTGFAICHCGESSEAGTDKCYVKFAAAKPGLEADTHFNDLLITIEDYAASQNVSLIEAGINLACVQASEIMKQKGYKTDILGVAMMRNNEQGYHHENTFVIDDWR